MSVILALGSNDTFVFDTPGGTITNNLPEPLRDLEVGIGPGKPILEIYCLEFGPNNSYILAARNAQGNIIRRNNLPPLLENYLISPQTHTCIRDIPTLRITLGPSPSFFARDSSSYRWHALPAALEDAVQSRLGPGGWKGGATPEAVKLGEAGAFVYANACGGSSYALGNYPLLQGLVMGLLGQNVGGHSGFALLQHILLPPHSAPHFIALLHSGIPHFDLPPTASAALSSMSATFPQRALPPLQPQSPPLYSLVGASSPTPSLHSHSHSVGPPQMMPKAAPVSPPQPQLVHQTSAPASVPQAQHQQQQQAVRPVMYTQQSAPVGVPQVAAAMPTRRPVGAAQQTRKSQSGMGQFLSQTLSGTISNVVGGSIVAAESGGGGGGGGGGSGGGGFDNSGVVDGLVSGDSGGGGGGGVDWGSWIGGDSSC
ncbi:WD repeat-containing protein 26 [Puttea exsequens]|nr:WD repeat-containing protein 26 [Puttea exsequens]